MPSIKHLKAGDEFWGRRVNQYGRYDFSIFKIQQITGVVAKCGYDRSFNRNTGVQTGYSTVGTQLSPWEAFPADDPEILRQMEEKKAGVLPPAIDPERVKLIRALDRLKNLKADQVAESPAAAEAITKFFGHPDDYREHDEVGPVT